MIVSLIAAMDRNRGIGKDNQLPWRLPADLKRFRELTTGHHLIVGRKTYESIGKPLPGREMIIISRDAAYKAEGCIVTTSLEKALEIARGRGEQEVFIGGGAEIYRQAIDDGDRIYLTLIDAEVNADVFFPAFDKSQWVEKESQDHLADEKNPFSFRFVVYMRG
jgi:dihydrofolate reductase